MKKKTLLLALLISAMPGFIACGTPNESIALEDLDTTLKEELCDARVQCGLFPDIATCIESTFVNLDQLKEGVESGTIVYDGKQARDCFDTIIDTSCDLVAENADDEDTSCADTFVGTVEAGGDCFQAEECAGDAFCTGSDDSTCTLGSCELLAQLGESCSEAFCAGTANCSDASVCVAPIARPEVGESCETQNCNASLCVNDICTALPESGESCDPNFADFGGLASCGDGTEFCDFTDTTCKPRLEPGEACPEAPQNACVAYASCLSGVCVAIPGLGDTCEDESQRCLGSLDCENGTCILEPADAVCPL